MKLLALGSWLLECFSSINLRINKFSAHLRPLYYYPLNSLRAATFCRG
jgi:hypothetical protein